MSAYQEFEKKAKTVTNLGQIGELLTWDQEVMMPEEGIKARSQQQSVLSRLNHQKLTEEKLGSLLDQLEDSSLDQVKEANVREVRRQHERAMMVPEELTQKISEKSSTCVEQWKKSRKEGDFESFAEELEDLVELKREYANQIDSSKEPYQVLFRDYEPYMDFEKVEQILERLKDNLTPLVEEIRENGDDIEKNAFDVSLSDDQNYELAHGISEMMDFEFEHGRLDTSTHPFTTGNQFDARITTRFKEDDISENILITMHETGHALYQLGLPREHYGLPAGSSRELSVHESQSRLWENHVGRSKQFWNYFAPEISEKFSEIDVSAKDCYESVNQVKFNNLIRTEADELTYHMHIIIRFEVGRALVNGEIEVEELPEVWNDKYEEYLGIRPDTDAEGIMQDIHWAWGNFGYFPTYTLGSVIAAQIFKSAEQEIDNLDVKIGEGELMPLRNWLKENIHSKGQIFKTEELIEEATGEKPNADHFLEYIEKKYGRIYGI